MPTYLERTPEAGDEGTAARNLANQGDEQARRGSTPDLIVSRLKESLPKGTTTEGSFHKGGKVKADGNYALLAGETVNAAPQTDSTQQAAPGQPDASTQDDSNLPEDDAAPEGEINLHRSFAKLQEALTTLADASGVKRAVTVPFQHGGETHAHIQEISDALKSHGGMLANVLTSFHKSGGRGFGSGDGSTQAWPAEKLRQTIIVKDDPNAIKAISAARSLVNLVAKLVGSDDKSVQVAKSQLSIIGKMNGSGMHVADLITALNSLVNLPLQTVARSFSTARHGEHHAALRASPRPHQKA
jgi:hypothetical protein